MYRFTATRICQPNDIDATVRDLVQKNQPRPDDAKFKPPVNLINVALATISSGSLAGTVIVTCILGDQ